ncbi:MAG: cation:proton antiporter subunit C [Candidatus Thermoplasmatota archaeon]|nr:cation:proton antiporter subunit C [Candidatus Thermoplasmatota archaeon]
MIANIPYLAVVGLIIIGLSAVIFKKNLIKIIIGITIIQSGVNLFLITLGYREGSTAPIWTSSPGGVMAFPVPQALTLTSIVIGVAVTALMLSLVIHLYRHHGTLDVRKMGGDDQ